MLSRGGSGGGRHERRLEIVYSIQRVHYQRDRRALLDGISKEGGEDQLLDTARSVDHKVHAQVANAVKSGPVITAMDCQ